jgi:hypothetical protein
MLVAVTISTVSVTTTMTAYATSEWADSDEIKDTIKAKNDDGRQAIADADCNPGDTSGFVFGDINQAQDCDALAANRDITQRETTDGEEEPPALTCEECFEKFLTPEQIEDLLAEEEETSLETFCAISQFLEENFRDDLTSIGVDEEEIDSLIECLKAAGVEFI